jgi:hypothetical protein
MADELQEVAAQHMHEVQELAKAGYERYHRSKTPRVDRVPWEQASGYDQELWINVTEAILREQRNTRKDIPP